MKDTHPTPAIVVRRRPGRPTQGVLSYLGRTMPVALGRGGTSVAKREGDGATPIGTFRLVSAFAPQDGRKAGTVRWSPLPFRTVDGSDGWCDAAEDRNYNAPVPLPYPASCERLARDDHLYDMVMVPDHNRAGLRPGARGQGSAVFMHLARPGYMPTEGCIALARRDMEWLWARVRPGTRLIVVR